MNSHQQADPLVKGSKWAVVCDFDGTIIDVDTGQLVLATFSNGDWMRYHEQYVRGEFSFEECLRRQYSHVARATTASILNLVEEHAHVRRGFEDLLAAAALAGAPVIVASYGLDFCIEHVMHNVRNGATVQVYSPKAELEEGRITLTFPSPRTTDVVNLKEDAVRWHKQKGFKVLFVGDGASDLPAV